MHEPEANEGEGVEADAAVGYDTDAVVEVDFERVENISDEDITEDVAPDTQHSQEPAPDKVIVIDSEQLNLF